MSKVVYLLGAGASYGKRLKPDSSQVGEVHNTIAEGLPLVSEIPSRLDYIIDLIKNTSVSTNSFSSRDSLIKDLQWLKDKSAVHATIDTFAKKLYLIDEDYKCNKVKLLLSIFFIIEQLINKPDSRYDTFFASVLNRNLKILDDISILTWNYDSQFEIVYKEYKKNRVSWDYRNDLKLMDLKRNLYDPYEMKIKDPSIFKINGTANFRENGSLAAEYSYDENLLDQTHLEFILKKYEEQNNQHDRTDITRLSFAWENEWDNKYTSTLQSSIKGTETAVVIGYTFPFFNREVDRKISSFMPDLKKIYIQDPNALMIKQFVPSVLSDFNKNAEVIPITNVNQFYLPPEL